VTTRNRYFEVIAPATTFTVRTFHPDGSPDLTLPGFSTGTFLVSNSSIEDVARSRVYIKPVGHTKRSVRYYPNISPAFFTNGYSQTYEPVPNNNSAEIQAFVSGHNPTGPSGAAVALLTDNAFRAMSDQVPQEVDLVNFGLDLREMGSLIPSLAENMARTVSGGYLTYAFGWKPFIGDLQKLGHLNATVTKRLNWLKETRGREVRLGYSSSWPYEGTSTIDIGGYSQATLTSSERRFRAGAYLFHLLERLDGIEGQLRAFSSALGLLNPSAVVWERIPFSFVADWFVRTDGIVNSLQLQPFSGAWNLRRISHSFYVKEEWTIKSTYTGATNTFGLLQSTLVVEKYSRAPFLPVSSSLLTETTLTPSQLVLAAALLGAATK